MRGAVVVALVVSVWCSVPARAASRETLLGFGADADLVAVAVDDDALGRFVRLCRLDPTTLPSAWPPALKIDEGTACATLSDADAGGPAEALAKELVRSSPPKKGPPFGLKQTLVVEGDGKDNVVTLTAGDGPSARTVRAASVTSDVPLKLGTSLWHPQGTIGVALLDGGKARSVVVVLDARELLKGSPAGTLRAVSLLKEAEAQMKKKEWSSAIALLDEAMIADDTNSAVRYARAAAEAQSGVGRTTMLEQLAWLKTAAATDPAARRLLDGASKDKAFDAWVGEPEVRELVGLPSLSSMSADARLLERSATWTKQGATCKAPWLTLTFAKGGQGTLEVQESCRGKKTKAKQPFRWSSADGAVSWKTAGKEVDDVVIPSEGSLELDGTYQQLRLSSDGVSAIGPFEPGTATLD